MIAEISTMLFARQYYNLPIARIYAWSVEQGSSSPVGVPFLLMERLPGRPIAPNEFLYKMDEETRLKILRSTTSLHLELAKPLPPSLQRYGRLAMRNLPDTCVSWNFHASIPLEDFEVSPYIESQKFRNSWEREDINRVLPTIAFDNISEYWLAATEFEFLELKRHFAKTLTQDEPYVLSGTYHISGRGQTASDLADAYRDLKALLGHYARTHSPTHPDQRPCLWHHDYKLSNMLFDPKTFDVTGIIDWEDASIVPWILSARYPGDLEYGGVLDDPSGYNRVGWSYYSHDYTVTFPSEYSLKCYIDATWYRFFYSGLLAGKDVRLGTRFWKESEMALKLSELVDEGFAGWLQKKEWLAESVAKISEEAK
jgi:hypothetical protein